MDRQLDRVRKAVALRSRLAGVLGRLSARLGASTPESGSTHTYRLHVAHAERLAHKRAIVTGGGGSIGSAVCYRLAAEGAVVGVAGRTPATIEATIEQIRSSGVPADRLTAVVMDVTSAESVAEAIESFVGRHGGLDILVNNAGGSARGKVHALADQDLETVDEIVDLNLLGTMRCCKYAIPHLTRGEGRIINVGSTIGFAGQRHYAEYSAAKSGIIGLTKTLALELGSSGTTVNMVTPGWVWRNAFDGERRRESTKTALGRYGTPEEVAGLIAYLCSDEAGYLTGNDIRVDGGRTLGLMGE